MFFIFSQTRIKTYLMVLKTQQPICIRLHNVENNQTYLTNKKKSRNTLELQIENPKYREMWRQL